MGSDEQQYLISFQLLLQMRVWFASAQIRSLLLLMKEKVSLLLTPAPFWEASELPSTIFPPQGLAFETLSPMPVPTCIANFSPAAKINPHIWIRLILKSFQNQVHLWSPHPSQWLLWESPFLNSETPQKNLYSLLLSTVLLSIPFFSPS